MKITLKGNSETTGVPPTPGEACNWWEWILSIPSRDNPLNGVTPSGNLPLTYLACTGGGEDTNRFLSVRPTDAQKDLLVPIFTSEYCTAELGEEASDERLLAQARGDVRDPKRLELIIDEKPIDHLERFYVEGGPFHVSLPPKHILDYQIKPGRYRAMCAGYWMKIKPTRAFGNHTIQFGGTGQNGFHTRVKYGIKTLNAPLIFCEKK